MDVAAGARLHAASTEQQEGQARQVELAQDQHHPPVQPSRLCSGRWCNCAAVRRGARRPLQRNWKLALPVIPFEFHLSCDSKLPATPAQ